MAVDSFVLMEPYWTVRTGSEPFGMVFNTERSAAALAAYLDRAGPFDENFLMLFSHGTDSVGVAPIETWRELLGRAAVSGALVGVDERTYPRDFAVYFRYHDDLLRKVQARHPPPSPLPLAALDEFLEQNAGNYPVQWR